MLIEIPPVPICRAVARAIIGRMVIAERCCCAASCANHEPQNVELMTRGLAEFRDQRHVLTAFEFLEQKRDVSSS